MASVRENTHLAIVRFWKSEEGATMLEYSIMLAFIAAISLVVVAAIGPKVKDCFKKADKAWSLK